MTDHKLITYQILYQKLPLIIKIINENVFLKDRLLSPAYHEEKLILKEVVKPCQDDPILKNQLPVNSEFFLGLRAYFQYLHYLRHVSIDRPDALKRMFRVRGENVDDLSEIEKRRACAFIIGYLKNWHAQKVIQEKIEILKKQGKSEAEIQKAIQDLIKKLHQGTIQLYQKKDGAFSLEKDPDSSEVYLSYFPFEASERGIRKMLQTDSDSPQEVLKRVIFTELLQAGFQVDLNSARFESNQTENSLELAFLDPISAQSYTGRFTLKNSTEISYQLKNPTDQSFSTQKPLSLIASEKETPPPLASEISKVQPEVIIEPSGEEPNGKELLSEIFANSAPEIAEFQAEPEISSSIVVDIPTFTGSSQNPVPMSFDTSRIPSRRRVGAPLAPLREEEKISSEKPGLRMRGAGGRVAGISQTGAETTLTPQEETESLSAKPAEKISMKTEEKQTNKRALRGQSSQKQKVPSFARYGLPFGLPLIPASVAAMLMESSNTDQDVSFIMDTLIAFLK